MLDLTFALTCHGVFYVYRVVRLAAMIIVSVLLGDPIPSLAACWLLTGKITSPVTLYIWALSILSISILLLALFYLFLLRETFIVILPRHFAGLWIGKPGDFFT